MDDNYGAHFEDLHCEQSLNFIRTENQRAVTHFTKDSRFKEIEEQALAFLTSESRLPNVGYYEGFFYLGRVNSHHCAGKFFYGLCCVGARMDLSHRPL